MTMNAIEAPPDTFHWLGEINKASAVMVVEQSIVPAALGATIAETIAKVIAAGNQLHAARPGDYLLLEAALIEAGGPDVTRVHSGRSRQDIGATLGCLYLRDDLLAVLKALTPPATHCSPWPRPTPMPLSPPTPGVYRPSRPLSATG